MTVHSIARFAICIVGVGLLSACASTPRISASTEAMDYKEQAGRTYTAPGPRSDPWGPYIQEAAAKYDVPERWIREVMHQESGGHLYNHGGSLITSGAGAMGLMQVMPATYDELRGRYSELGHDPFDPHNNIMAGTAYIREMYDIYGSPGFLAAYNAGPGRLDDYLTRNRTLPAETRRYVANIGPRIAGAEPRTPSPGAQFAMNALPTYVPDGPRDAGVGTYTAPAPAIEPVRAPIQLASVVEAPRLAPVAEAPRLASVIEATPVIQAPTRPRIVLRPQPVEVAELPEPPRPLFTPAPVPRTRPEPVRFAQLPEPPRFVAPSRLPEPIREQRLASAELVPLTPHGSRFALVSQARAEPIGAPRGGPATGNWSVQVGAFVSHNLAESAASSARDQARGVLSRAHESVTTVRQPRGMLYRARLNGLSRNAADEACQRLQRQRTRCIVVSPDAQS